jgi:hypothetical protein
MGLLFVVYKVMDTMGETLAVTVWYQGCSIDEAVLWVSSCSWQARLVWSGQHEPILL